MDELCKQCGRPIGGGRSCQFCRHVIGFPDSVILASPGRRFCGLLLDLFLIGITLGIGYFIWSIFTFRKGQTPAKQLLGMRVVRLNNSYATRYWGTAFREWIAKWVVGAVATGALAVLDFWLLWDKDNQELWDKFLGTVVVNDPNGLTLSPEARPKKDSPLVAKAA